MVIAISLWYLLQFKDNSMKCHLAMKLCFFSYDFLEFLFSWLCDVFHQYKETSFVCMCRSFIQLLLTILRVWSRYICLIFFTFLQTAYFEFQKKRHYGRNILFKFYPSFYGSVNGTFLRDSLKRRAPVNGSDHSLRISFNLKVLF